MTQLGRGSPYTHADFVRLALTAFPILREELEEHPDLLHLQMHAFTRLVEDARVAGDWPTYRRATVLAHELWSRPDEALINALNVSFLEHLHFDGPNGPEAWGYLTPELQYGWRAMYAYMERLSALPRKQRPVKPRRRRR